MQMDFQKEDGFEWKHVNQQGKSCSKSFSQIHGIDYEETFWAVAMFKSIRIMLAIAAFHGYEIWLRDVKTAFIKGKLEEMYI